MARILSHVKCSNPNCSTYFDYTTYHYAGSINDKDAIMVKCNSCGAETEILVENVETLSGLENCKRLF